MIVLCSKCHRPNDRAPHRYCSRCHAGYMRTWRNPMRLAMIQFNAGLAIFHLAAWILRQDNPMLSDAGRGRVAFDRRHGEEAGRPEAPAAGASRY